MSAKAYITESYARPMRIALIVGVVFALIGVAGLLLSGPVAFFQAYLVAFQFWLGLSLGSLGILLLHFAVRSRWGLTIRRVTEAASSTIWIMGIFFLPLLFGLPYLYPWARPADVAASAMLQYKQFYLNVPFFIARAVLYFVVWIVIAYLINRYSKRMTHLTTDELAEHGRAQGWSAFGLVLYGLTMTFAATDWLMSLEPEWSSTAFGMTIVLMQVLSAMAFAILSLNLLPSLSMGKRWTTSTTPIPYRDLGALLLTLVMGWAYVSYFQMLIQWAGNIPREVFWYVERTRGGWNILAIFITISEFALPFMILLSFRMRHNLRRLAWLSGLLLVAFWANVLWHIKPAFFAVFTIGWLDIVLTIAVGGLWLAGFMYMLQRRPALSLENQAVLELDMPINEEGRVIQH